MTVMILLIFASIALWKIPKLVKEKRWRGLAVFCSFLAIACAGCLFLSAQIKITSPKKTVERVIDALKHP
ncbi:MAG: hypothetical protein ACOYU3_09770 [Bacillota bacterium]